MDRRVERLPKTGGSGCYVFNVGRHLSPDAAVNPVERGMRQVVDYA